MRGVRPTRRRLLSRPHSPHIDHRDTSFQYALSLGEFEGGELCVEAEGGHGVAVVETRGRIARVDGRHVHWVRTHRGGDRFSLIFYNTTGTSEARGAPVDGTWAPFGA